MALKRIKSGWLVYNGWQVAHHAPKWYTPEYVIGPAVRQTPRATTPGGWS